MRLKLLSAFLSLIIVTACDDGTSRRLEITLHREGTTIGDVILLTIRNVGDQRILLPTCCGISVPVQKLENSQWQDWGGINISCEATCSTQPYILEQDAVERFYYSPGFTGDFRFVLVDHDNQTLGTKEFSVTATE